MRKKQLSRRELEERLKRAEALISALKAGEIDAVIGCEDISFVRSRQVDEDRRRFNSILEQRVAERTQQLQKLTLELTDAEHRERRRLARMLHDEVQPLIVGAKIWLSMLRESADETVRDILDKTDDLLTQSVDATRSLSVAISPPNLFDFGIRPTLEWLCTHMNDLHGLTVSFTSDDGKEPAQESLRALLYEAVRELLFNIVKHGKTSRAEVYVHQTRSDTLTIDVRDDGVGFTISDIEPNAGTGLGLFSIRKRLEAVGGKIEIESTPGRGTTVSLEVPAEPDD